MSAPPNRKGLWLADLALSPLLLIAGIVAFAPRVVPLIMGSMAIGLLFAKWVFSHGKK